MSRPNFDNWSLVLHVDRRLEGKVNVKDVSVVLMDFNQF